MENYTDMFEQQLSDIYVAFTSLVQVVPGNDQNTSPTNQKTAGSKLERTS